jgi:hypothetical protein
MNTDRLSADFIEPDGICRPFEAEPEAPPAWEMIENGRYMPRRIRGSLLGRELGWTFFVPPGPGEKSGNDAEHQS